MRVKWWTVILVICFDGTGSANADTPDLPFVDTFKTQNHRTWEVANYQFSHPHFDTDWVKQNVVFGAETPDKNGLLLHLSPKLTKSSTRNTFAGASIRRQTTTHFGRYEAWIKPARGPGVVTGFFTYTGPYYGTQHDEIDIEFLGKNTRQLHVAWFNDGVLTNKFIELPFDAAETAHLYAFDWLHDRITWYVDDKEIYSVTNKQTKIPQTPSRLFANIWAADPSIAVWAGKTRKGHTAKALFDEISFTPVHQLINADTLGAATMMRSTGSVAPVTDG